MRVLAACEYSGVVRDAFLARGHEAISCDLLPTEAPGPHYQGDVFDLDLAEFDLMVASPPCTDLAASGARWFAEKRADGRMEAALEFVRRLLDAPVKHIAIENPVGQISAEIRKPEQVIHPWQYGHGEQKRTCLWLKNLPLLVPTNIVEGRAERVLGHGQAANRGKHRSRFYPGIAAAMADQWSAVGSAQMSLFRAVA